jgi:hypothetical protein
MTHFKNADIQQAEVINGFVNICHFYDFYSKSVFHIGVFL